MLSLATAICVCTRLTTLLSPPARPAAFAARAVVLLAVVACAELPGCEGAAPFAAFWTASPCVVVGNPVPVAGALAATTAECAGFCKLEELAASRDICTVVLLSAYFNSIALIALRRAPTTSTCLSGPVATANSVPRTANVVLGVTTLKSLDSPTLSTLKSARPCFTAAAVRSVSPSCTIVGSWNNVPASINAVAFRPTRIAACERRPVRTSTPAATTSFTLASCQGLVSLARHCTLPATSMKTARNGSPAGTSEAVGSAAAVVAAGAGATAAS